MSFTDEIKRLGEDIATSYDIRVSSVGDIIKDTHSTLRNFHTERKHMSEEQRSELEHFRKELMNMTRKMLNQFDKEHKEMADELRMDLAKVPKMLKEFMTNFLKAQNQFHNMLDSYYKNEIKKPVHGMLGKYHREMQTLANEFQKAHEAWQSFSRSTAAKRAGKPIPKKKMMTKAERICSVLEGHPKGMTQGMIAKEMECTAKSLQLSLAKLKKQGTISKKQNKYYLK